MTKPKRLNEAQAWRVLAVLFNSPPAGLCAAVDELRYGRLITSTTANRMRRVIRRAVNRASVGGWIGWLTNPRFTRPTEDGASTRCETRIKFAKRQAARAGAARRGRRG